MLEQNTLENLSMTAKMERLLKSKVNVSPMLLNGKWGIGKTTFCKKLLQTLDSKGFYPIYINAFYAEYGNNPLMAILSSINEHIKSKPKKKKDKKYSELAKRISLLALGITAKVGVSWLLRTNSENVNNEINDIVSMSASSTTDYLVNKKLENSLLTYKKIEESIDEVGKILKEIANDNHIIMIIDELDQCKPDFAINMLETIKHIFNIENVIFIIVSDLVMLESIIQHHYGDVLDSAYYLNKFFNFKVNMPEAVFNDCNHVSLTSVICFNDYINSKSTSFFDNKIVKEICAGVIHKKKLTINQVKRYINHIEIYKILNSSTDKLGKDVGEELLILLGIFIFCFDEEIAGNILNNNIDAHDIVSLFGLDFSIEPENFSKESCTHHQKIATMLAAECKQNSETVKSGNCVRTQWWPQIEQYFSKSNISYGKRLNKISEVIKTLSLWEK